MKIGTVLRAIRNVSSVCASSHPPTDAISRSARLLSCVLKGISGSGGIDGAHRDHADGGHTGQEKVVAAAGGHKFGQAGGDERGGVRRAGRDDVLVGLGATTDQGTAVVTGLEVQAVIDPLLLDELELPEQARTDPHENDALLAAGIDVR